jgi:methylamine dehydrogenase heavy chain
MGVLKSSTRLASIPLFGLALLAAGAAAQPGSPSEKPVLPVEQSDVAVIPPPGPHRLVAIGGFTGPAVVFDPDDEGIKSLGSIPLVSDATTAMTRDGNTIVVAETHWSHRNRGQREDILAVYDSATLKLTKEIPIPGMLHVVPKMQVLSLSDDDKLAYIYDMLPASSIHVVDIAKGKLLTSVDIPGCALGFPFGTHSFGTLCGDGTIGSVDLAKVSAPRISFTAPVFDADNDPIYENSVVDRTTGQAWMLSYTGLIYPVQFGDGAPVVGQPWSIAEAAGLRVATTGVQDLAWRPGGGQLLALHRASRRLYVLMHPGNHWTHKQAGSEVWVVDTDQKKVIRRFSLKLPMHNIAVTQGDDPLLYLFVEEGHEDGMTVMDATTGKVLRSRPKVLGSLMMVPGQ